MQSQDSYNQLTVYYTDGSSESFNIFPPLEEESASEGISLNPRTMMQQPQWILTLPEQTVVINVANVTKVEIKPPQFDLQGEDVFNNAERVTALNRSR